MLLTLAFAAFLPSSVHAQEPSLTSVMESFVKEPGCIGDEFMGVRIALIASPRSGDSRPRSGDFRAMSSGAVLDMCLARRQFLFSAQGRPRNATYLEFKGSGQFTISDTDRPEDRTADFELTLGQPDISGFDEVIPGTNLTVRRTERLNLGTLVINFRNGRKQFSLPDSLTIAAPQNSLTRFIYGEIDGGKAVISIVIENCNLQLLCT